LPQHFFEGEDFPTFGMIKPGSLLNMWQSLLKCHFVTLVWTCRQSRKCEGWWTSAT